MILTFEIVIVFIAVTTYVSTLPLEKIKQKNYFISEELPKPLKSLDPDYKHNLNVHHKSFFSQKDPNAQTNINEGLRKTIAQAPITHHLDQKLALNYGYNQTEASDMKEYENEKVIIQPIGLFNTSKVHSNDDMIDTRGVFPEEQFSKDVLASVQKESFHGFPKGENQQHILKKNIDTVSVTYNNSFEKKSGLNDEIVYAPNHENNFTTEKSTNLTETFIDGIGEAQVQITGENGKSNNETEEVTSQEKLRSKHNQLKKITDQKKEDDLRIKNAKYSFSTSQKDGISDLLHDRTETRQDGKVTGSYTYSDGFLLRKVNYVADQNGYRIISEDSMPLPGNGPKVNPKGTAHIKSDVSGYRAHYVVHGEKLPQRNFRRQGNSKI